MTFVISGGSTIRIIETACDFRVAVQAAAGCSNVQRWFMLATDPRWLRLRFHVRPRKSCEKRFRTLGRLQEMTCVEDSNNINYQRVLSMHAEWRKVIKVAQFKRAH